MSRGRSHHQASRRRAYSVRQREIRERSFAFGAEQASRSSDGWTGAEREDRAEQRAPASWALGSPSRTGLA